MADLFANTRPGKIVRFGGKPYELPALYYKDQSFALIYTADRDAVQALLPSEKLKVLPAQRGRTMVGIAAFNYVDSTLGSYGEMGIVVPCRHGEMSIGNLLRGKRPLSGNLMAQLTVTSHPARDVGKGEWGYPKFLGDIAFRSDEEAYEIEVGEAGTNILTMRVPKRAPLRGGKMPLATFSVLDGNLVHTVMHEQGEVRRALFPKKASLKLGDHPVSKLIEQLDLSPVPAFSQYYLDRQMVLPAGEIVERGVRPLDGYQGGEQPGVHSLDEGFAQPPAPGTGKAEQVPLSQG